MHNKNNDAHSLGKGEVDSSILSGSTRKPRISPYFFNCDDSDPAVSSRTPREHDAPIRGKSVDSVHGPIREQHR